MSAESPFSPGDFGLIETLLWTRADGYWLAAGHRARMENSARTLGFAFSPEAYELALTQACAESAAERLRVRLELRRDGRLLSAVAAFAPEPAEKIWRVGLAATRLQSDDPLLRHKTTRRAHYENALAQAQKADPRLDEVIFLNERDEICEGARTSIFLPRDGALLTPPLACGLLAGVLRADLLARGVAREQNLSLCDLRDGFLLGNALRSQFQASLRA